MSGPESVKGVHKNFFEIFTKLPLDPFETIITQKTLGCKTRGCEAKQNKGNLKFSQPYNPNHS